MHSLAQQYTAAQQESSWAWIVILTIILGVYVLVAYEPLWKQQPPTYFTTVHRHVLRVLWWAAVVIGVANVLLMLVMSYLTVLS